MVFYHLVLYYMRVLFLRARTMAPNKTSKYRTMIKESFLDSLVMHWVSMSLTSISHCSWSKQNCFVQLEHSALFSNSTRKDSWHLHWQYNVMKLLVCTNEFFQQIDEYMIWNSEYNINMWHRCCTGVWITCQTGLLMN